MICPDCRHEHAGEDLGFICVGCPCEKRPTEGETSLMSANTECSFCALSKLALQAWADRSLRAERDRDTMAETLTIAQARGTELVEENRLLKARLARYGA